MKNSATMQTIEGQNYHLRFLDGRKTILMLPEQIVRLEASNNYTRVFFTDRPPVIMAKVLRAYDRLLYQHGFVRTHRSHLVNLRHVDSLDKMGIVHMRDDSKVETSRRKRRLFRRNLENHISTLQLFNLSTNNQINTSNV